MLGGIVDLFASSGIGAIVGVVGSFMTKVEDRKLQKQKAEHELKMTEARAKEFEAESSHELAMADKQVERAQAESAIAAEVVDGQAFLESQKEHARTYKSSFANFVRGMMRPAITVYFLALATIITINLHIMVGGLNALDENVILELYAANINQALFLTTLVITWWFGARPASKRK